jgi:hypothetical protein
VTSFTADVERRIILPDIAGDWLEVEELGTRGEKDRNKPDAVGRARRRGSRGG